MFELAENRRVIILRFNLYHFVKYIRGAQLIFGLAAAPPARP
jgi:hypothetical protein